MGEVQNLPTYITGEEAEGANSTETAKPSHQTIYRRLKRFKWWIQMAIYVIFAVTGSASGTLLGRLYYDKGGNSKWIGAFVQIAGFPILVPFFFISKTKPESVKTEKSKQSAWILPSVYVLLGLFLAFDTMLYSVGLMHLPVTTFSVISASQLGFNALFSFFLNAQKFTPYIVNSLVLLTISATLLVFQPSSGESGESSGKNYTIGFMSTLAGSAGFALMLSVTQLTFQKIIKKETFRQVLNWSFFQGLVASLVILIGLFASGEWKSVKTEMGEFELGKVSYVMTLFWTAVSWQAFGICSIGLIFKVSSLFANVISMFSLPVAPVLAVIIFKDKMTGLKVVAMMVAIWGFVSYIYQHYLDDLKARTEKKHSSDVSDVSLVEER